MTKPVNMPCTCLSLSHMLPIVLHTAIELHLFDIISQSGPAARLSPSEIASQIPPTTHTKNPTDNSASASSVSILDRLLQLLATHSLLTCSVPGEEDDTSERRYGLTSAGKYFVEGGGVGGGETYSSFASFVRMSFHPASREAWLKLKDAVNDGGTPFQNAHGMSLYQYMNIDPTMNEVFNKSMVGQSTIIMTKILKIYRGFEGLTSLVDVGGGIGTILNMIVSAYPSIKGINFDLPQVISSAPSYPGIKHAEGDMFSSVPQGVAVMIKDVLHNWGDEQCLKLLKNCYDVVPNNGKVIIMERIKPNETKSSIAAKYATELDSAMLLYVEGKARTEKEFKSLCKGSGFSNYQIVCSAHSQCVIEFHK